MNFDKASTACTSECAGSCAYMDDMVRDVPELLRFIRTYRRFFQKEVAKTKKTDETHVVAPLAVMRALTKLVEDTDMLYVLWSYRENYVSLVDVYKTEFQRGEEAGNDRDRLAQLMGKFMVCVVKHVSEADGILLLAAFKMFVSLSNATGNVWSTRFNFLVAKHIDAELRPTPRLCTKRMKTAFEMFETRLQKKRTP